MGSRFHDLAVQAAAEGVVDFSQTRFENWRWQLRLNKLLNYLELKNHRERQSLRLHEYLSHITRQLTAEARETLAQIIQATQVSIERSYEPSVPEVDDQKALADKAETALSDWESEFGPIKDPFMQERINSVVAGMLALQQQTNREVSQLPPSIQAEIAQYKR